MIKSSKCRLFGVGLVAAVLLPIETGAVAATSELGSHASDTDGSLSGDYLAALIASADRDTASADTFYREALRIDPHNTDLQDRAFAAALSNGDEPAATALAERLLARNPGNNLARLTTAVHAIGQNQFSVARAQLATVDPRSRDLTSTFLIAWTYAGEADLRRALEALDRIHDPSVTAFRDYHAGLIADQLGNAAEAQRRFKSAYTIEGTTLRFADAYARFLAAHGDVDGAKKIYGDLSIGIPHHPIVESARESLNSGQTPAMTVRNAKEGAAEVLSGLGGAGSRQGDELPALIYLRLSLYLRPSNDLTAVTLATLFGQMKQDEQAIAAYELVPATSPLREDAQIQIALENDTIGKRDEAIGRLSGLLATRPNDADALSSLAAIQRSAKKYGEAAALYDRAIAAVGITRREHWTLFYFRGICFERNKQWPKAEADFKKALELYPEQPLVLNYLGYSWVDQGINLDEALGMLRRAADLRPNDGYIVDSLGWAHFKLGQYLQATQILERAINLKPADPVLNDHLGDAYWRVDRQTEAHFQWNHARDMGPEPEELPAILKKIEYGLPEASTGLPVPSGGAAEKKGGG